MPMGGQRLGIQGNPFPSALGHYLQVNSFSEPRGFQLPEEVPEAYAEWGEPSQFVADPLPDLSGSLSFEVVGEIAPLTKTLLQRVENPDDEAQFVEVERPVKMTFAEQTTSKRLTFKFDTSRYEDA